MNFLQAALNSIPHPIVVGCIAIGLGALVIGSASEFKSRADRARKSRGVARLRAARFLLVFVAALLVGAALTAFGTWLTIHGGTLDADAKAREATNLLNQTRAENEQARKEFDVKLQTVLVALNAAKQEQTRILTEEKIKGIRNDFLKWAGDFAQRKPDKQRQFEQAKVAERQKEIQISSESLPLFLYIVRFSQEAVAAYMKQPGVASEMKVSIPQLPENLYDETTNQISRNITFGGKARWDFYVGGNLPANEDQSPYLSINLTSSEGRPGNINIRRVPKEKKFVISGSGTLPVSNATSLFGEYDMQDYEETIGRVFQRLIEGQLIDIPTPTPSPSPVSG